MPCVIGRFSLASASSQRQNQNNATRHTVLRAQQATNGGGALCTLRAGVKGQHRHGKAAYLGKLTSRSKVSAADRHPLAGPVDS